MKNILLNIGFFLSILLLHSCVKAETSFHEDARCTGSAYCSACSNCSRCGHCSSGGSCGVCRGNSSGRSFYSAPKKHKATQVSSKSTSYRNAYSRTNGLKTNPVVVNLYASEKLKNSAVSITKFTNIHKKPSLKSPVIEMLPKGSTVKILENRHHWKKIKVIKNGNIGFVYSRHLN